MLFKIRNITEITEVKTVVKQLSGAWMWDHPVECFNLWKIKCARNSKQKSTLAPELVVHWFQIRDCDGCRKNGR